VAVVLTLDIPISTAVVVKHGLGELMTTPAAMGLYVWNWSMRFCAEYWVCLLSQPQQAFHPKKITAVVAIEKKKKKIMNRVQNRS
jgi:hypothetical protein